MKEYIKSHLNPNSILIIGSLFLYSVGFFIHNNYLSTYKVANFDLIKGKYVYTGLTYLIVVLLGSLLLSINLSFSSDPRSNFKPKNIFLWFFRFEGLLLLTYSLFPGKETGLFDGTNLSIFGLFNIPGDFSNTLCLTFAFMYLIWIMTIVGSKNEWSKEKSQKYDLINSLVLFVPFTFIVIWGVMFDRLFRHLFGFYSILVCSILGYLMGAVDTSKRIPTEESFFFRDQINPLRRNTERKIFLFLILSPTFILSMALYAKYIYGMLPNNFGGAKPIRIQMVLSDNKTIDAELIDETEKEFIVFQGEEKLVSRISKNNVIKSDIRLKELKK